MRVRRAATAAVGPALAGVARAHNRDMLQRAYFDHDSPEGEGPPEGLRRAGIPFSLWGENISTDRSVPRAHAADMSEPEPGYHRDNILGHYTYIGIAVDGLPNGDVLITVMFTRR